MGALTPILLFSESRLAIFCYRARSLARSLDAKTPHRRLASSRLAFLPFPSLARHPRYFRATLKEREREGGVREREREREREEGACCRGLQYED